MRTLKLVAIAGFLVAVMKAADFPSCPARIEVRPQQIATPVAGWTAAIQNDPAHLLSHVELYEGEPKERASQAPDRGTKRTVTWTLLPTARYWLECHYTQTTIVLSRPIPAGLKTCTVTTDLGSSIDGHAAIQSITCQ